MPSSPELPEGEDWHDHRHNVLNTLRRLESNDREQMGVLVELKTSLAILSTKVALYAAGVAVLVTGVVEIVSKLVGK